MAPTRSQIEGSNSSIVNTDCGLDVVAKSFEGAEIAVTGRMASMSQFELGDLVRKLGGRLVRKLSQQTRVLIVGQADLPLEADGQPTLLLEQAQQLRHQGLDIEVVPEDVFLRQLERPDCDDRIHRRYNALEMSRALNLPPHRIRAWVKQKLIEPVDVVNGVALFGFHQIAAARTLCRLVDSGLPAGQIRKGLRQLSRLIPEAGSLLSQISVVESTSRLLVRLQNGLLSEASGQLQLDFDEAGDSESQHLTFTAVARTNEDLFDDAVALESAGRFEEAADTYRMAVSQDASDPVLRFNLGNVLFHIGQLDDAATQFRRAVLLDPLFVDAWNNLAAILYELGQADEAMIAVQRAIRLAPSHAEAAFNLQRMNLLSKSDVDSCAP